MQKAFSHHESCPKCNSSDNLGVWTDGQKYCFGCGYVVEASIFSKGTNVIPYTKNKQLVLPPKCSFFYPERVLKWIDQYNLEDRDLVKNSIQWCAETESLVYPIYNDNKLVAYETRYFGEDSTHPKSKTFGKLHDYADITWKTVKDELVVVEDKISQIKVAKQFNCWCLHGSHIKHDIITELSLTVKLLHLWLDYDKIVYANGVKLRYGEAFDRIHVIQTLKDPKYYSESEIRGTIRA